MSKLNILELHRTYNELKNKHTECFEKIVEICHKKIISQTKRQKLFCFYEVPLFVLGFPIFDITKCIEYLKNSLESNGFLVKYYFPKYLYISWDFDEIKSHKETSKNKQARVYDSILSYKPSGKLQLNLV